jgi:hypothetical protein
MKCLRKTQYQHGYYHARAVPTEICNTKLKPNILCVIGHPHNHPPPETPATELTIHFLEFTYCNDRFAAETLDRKITKYQPLINDIRTRDGT